MVKHGSISRSHVYSMLASKDARVHRAAFTLLEGSNPRLRRNSELFIEIARFIWDANPSYDVFWSSANAIFSSRIKCLHTEASSSSNWHRLDQDLRPAGNTRDFEVPQ
jgi:hypothetical protein